MQADVPQSFTAKFRTKNTQLFSDTAWVDLDDLQGWLRQRGDLDHLLDPTISERCGIHVRMIDAADLISSNA
jgi:hypothetical protein